MAKCEFTGKWTCNKCGGTDRYAGGRCRTCSKAYAAANRDAVKARNAAWYAANKEKSLRSSAEWRAKNPERYKELKDSWHYENYERHKSSTQKWRAANVERVRETMATWRAANPGAVKAHIHNRRARKINATGALSTDIEPRLMALQRGLCACCGKPLGSDYHLDHILPLARGGRNEDANMQLLRAACNLRKHDRHPVEYMQAQGYLL